ncbi:MAG: DNA2/NAM7 family helicase, partial [Clostridia bacterium]|nr:DNA2/NAM7 family helicase [Clostridia bacterium]
SAIEKFSVYEEKKSYAKPKLLDFKTKKLYLELKGLGYGKELSFEQVVKGVCLYSKAQAFNQTLEDIKVRLSSHFKIKFTKEQITTLFAFVKASNDAGVEESSYVKEFIACKETIYNAINECGCDLDYSLSDLLKTFIKADVLQRLKKDVKFFVEVSGFCFDGDDEVELAKAIYLAGEIVKCGAIGQNVEEIIEKATAIYTAGKSISPALIKVKNLLLDFANTCYKNYYTIKYDKCTVGELSVIIKEGQDRSLLSAVCEYLKIIKADNGVCSLERFFRPFETGIRQREGYSFKEILELSVNFLAVEYKKATMGGLRNGLGDKISHEFDNWKNAYSQIDRATLSIIESQCMAKIDCNDQDFNFLKAEKQSGVTLRRFFKDYAKAILKLKKCFILSPSTASVFFTKDDYADFDIVIVDEASQLEPTAILPILFRAKQVVLVGDEWQMPPIKHFSARTEKRIYDSDGEVKILSPNTSVLGLALDNCAFPVEQLACHYRSKTESLITFSQERFYPNMKTFPARVPKADGLGFKDVYVQDGRCEGGVNELEAAQVVEELRLHFDKYYDEKECSLGGHSIGVVAFGKEQKDEIESLVAKDKELSKKIQKAIDKFDDLPEKLIFFKTIETVQGQEAEHLILSLTYGRGKTGKIVQSFGELNRGFNEDKLGQCIFNVAVTRAKSSVTVIHSVLAEEITLESVAFIGKYLSIVDRFGKENKDQWVGKSIDEASGYIKQIANFIVENGVSADRVVIDYGVNETSVKIPIAILSEDMTQAELGLWCEKPLAVNTNYFDYNVRYVESLKDRGWIIHKTFIHDWVDNNQSEKESLAKAIKKYVKITNKEVQNG